MTLRIEPETPLAMPAMTNLAEIERIESALTRALDLATAVEGLESMSHNISTKVALCHAANMLVDAVTCLRNASTIARRDGR